MLTPDIITSLAILKPFVWLIFICNAFCQFRIKMRGRKFQAFIIDVHSEALDIRNIFPRKNKAKYPISIINK